MLFVGSIGISRCKVFTSIRANWIKWVDQLRLLFKFSKSLKLVQSNHSSYKQIKSYIECIRSSYVANIFQYFERKWKFKLEEKIFFLKPEANEKSTKFKSSHWHLATSRRVRKLKKSFSCALKRLSKQQRQKLTWSWSPPSPFPLATCSNLIGPIDKTNSKWQARVNVDAELGSLKGNG